MIHSFFKSKYKPHFLLLWGLAIFFFQFLFTACDTQGEDVYASFSLISPTVVYKADAANQYEVAFGNYTGNQLNYVLDKDLTSRLKVWWVKDSVTKELQIDTLITLQRNAKISFIQLASGEPLRLFNQPEYPDSSSVQRTQLFYSTATLPDSVKVTLVAVDRYNFTVTAGNNFSKADPIDTVATFTLKRNMLSPFIDLDLNCFRGGTKGYEAYFYYSVTNAATGAVVQALNKNVRLKVEQVSTTTTDRFKAKYKFALMQWSYSGSYPFNTPSILVGTTR